ncbi:hypothetical protein [uncultured Dietzia sp.]|uniref:hypothetical protein n=1 Tax=uncultured Dietzia sp. TaxID=395519 RepID=UPI0030F84528
MRIFMQIHSRAATAITAAALLAFTTGGATAFAEPDESGARGSLSSSGLGLGDAIGDLAIAAKALNGPVTVTPNATGGPTVTYTNVGTETDQCVGFAAPYSTIVDKDLDVGYDTDDLAAGLELLKAIEAGPDVSLLLGDEDGEPFVEADDPTIEESIATEVVGLMFEWIPENPPPRTVVIEPGESVSWTLEVPESPAAAGVLCIAGTVTQESELITNFGIDKQVVADQINGKIPGGSVEPVSAGSISGGSVAVGAGALGSLADGEVEPPVVE